MPPIISIIGKAKSGKTTLVERLISELKSRGYRVATIKHAPQGMSIDETDKDNWRHLRAGSEATAIISPDKTLVIIPTAKEIPLDEIAQLFGEDYDVIFTEGYKQASNPKIEVHRKEVGPPLEAINRLIAIVTDEPLETKTRQFAIDDVKGLADLLEDGFLKPQRERVSLYINNNPIPLSVFPREVITNVLLSMASSLKGVGEIESLKIFVKKAPR